MSNIRNDNPIFREIATYVIKMISLRKGYKTILVLFVAIITISTIPGCGELNEIYVLTKPVYPTGLSSTEAEHLRFKEIQRQQFQYDEFGQTSLIRNGRDRIPGPGIPILTWRFGKGSSRPDLEKKYALYNANLNEHIDPNSSNINTAHASLLNDR